MNDESELLRRYADERAEVAFAEIVRRHIGLVYHAALRQTGDATLAEDVTQAVFTDLARKAGALAGRASITGWLYTSTRFAATKARRGEQRRRAREQEVYAMQTTATDRAGDLAAKADWEQLRPVIDEALLALDERDREAVLLRFFEGRPLAEVGAKLAVSEDAARKRVARALDTLQGLLAQRGINSTTAALGVVLGGQAGVAAPAGLVATVTTGALAGAATGVGWSAGVKLAFWTAVAIGLVGAGMIVQQGRAIRALRAESVAGERGSHSAELARLNEENRRLASMTEEVQILRKDDEELMRLRDEAARLSARLSRTTSAVTTALGQVAGEKPGEVTVAGQIRRPGRVALESGRPTTLAALIAAAGGSTELAKTQAVRVTRRQPDGRVKIEVCDLTGAGGDFVLKAGDIVYVPERIL